MSQNCTRITKFFSLTVGTGVRKRSYQRPSTSIVNDRVSQRRFVTNSSNRPPHTEMETGKLQLLKEIENYEWLGKRSPCFPVSGDKVRILNEPHTFYETLMEKISKTNQRITLASLYLGTGSHERELIEAIQSALQSSSGSNLKVRFLLDATRGSRGASASSRTMLLPLVKSHSQQCSVNFYHTPALRGLLKKVLPERWNEVVGLQHMKIYIFDDSLLISGANLSHDYFTNRQDRYVIIEDSKELVDFFDQLVETVSQFSLQLNSDNRLSLNSNFPYHPYESDHQKFTTEAKRRIESLFEMQRMKNSATVFGWPNAGSSDTWIFPFVQMGQLNIFMDSVITHEILEKIPPNAELCLATGYFNLTNDYMNSLLEAPEPNIHILMAHPLANGFFGARGFAGGIPAAYTLLAFQFFQRVMERARAARIRLWEYQRQDWTFHAKGLWISIGEPRPCLTLIGSPNFGYRSVYRDLEAQIAIVTINSNLRDQLHQERRNLYQKADLVDRTTFNFPERKVPLWVRLVIKVFRRFF